MVCRNICLRYARTNVSYLAGGKHCSKCEYYVITSKLFCECCGMRLRSSPSARAYKEKVRAKKNELMEKVLEEGDDTSYHYYGLLGPVCIAQ